MSVKPKFSKHFEAVRTRIRRLPKLGIGLMQAGAQGSCAAVRDRFKEGLERDDLRLRRLQPRTVDDKARRDLELPENPLYALGLEDPDSYINALEIVKVSDRKWKLTPRQEWHHGKRRPEDVPKKRILLSDLFDVHEYGTIITNGFGRGIYIRIPPRPALRFAYHAIMRGMARRENIKAVRDAIVRFVRLGDDQALARVHAKLLGQAERVKD